jgi:hypothetical protein
MPPLSSQPESWSARAWPPGLPASADPQPPSLLFLRSKTVVDWSGHGTNLFINYLYFRLRSRDRSRRARLGQPELRRLPSPAGSTGRARTVTPSLSESLSDSLSRFFSPLSRLRVTGLQASAGPCAELLSVLRHFKFSIKLIKKGYL